MTNNTKRAATPKAGRRTTARGRVVVTGFEAFGELTHNPTAWVVEALLQKPPVRGLVGHVLPVAYDDAARAMEAILDERPRALLLLGVSKAASAILLERYAHNLDDTRVPDNALVTRLDQRIEPLGPAAYATTIPVVGIRDALRAAGIPAQASSTAGHYLCNHAYYRALHGAATRALALAAGFAHVPVFPDQAATMDPAPPSMSRETLLAGVQLMLRFIAKTNRPSDH